MNLWICVVGGEDSDKYDEERIIAHGGIEDIDNGIEQYSFDDGTYLNTTYGNIVKRHLTGLNGYVNWVMFKNTRLFVNGGVSYVDLRSKELDARNNGWQANFIGGLQQTLPWKFKLSAYFISQS